MYVLKGKFDVFIRLVFLLPDVDVGCDLNGVLCRNNAGNVSQNMFNVGLIY